MLLEKEVIFRDNLETIFGRRTFARDLEREEEEKVAKVEKAKKKEAVKVAREKAEQESQLAANPQNGQPSENLNGSVKETEVAAENSTNSEATPEEPKNENKA